MQMHRWAALALALSFSPSITRAAVIVANTGVNNLSGGQGSSLLLGAGFLSPTVGTTITSVVLPFDVNDVSPDSGSISLTLYTNNGGVPGAVLASLGSISNVPAVGPVADFTFTPGAPVNLAASTQYWLVTACACPSTVVNWGGTVGVVVAGLAGANVTPSAFFSTDGGSTWGSTSDRTFIFQVNGDETAGGAVPEPSTFALTLGAAALLYFKRRR